MINLLLISPQTKQSQGGMTIWTDVFLENCNNYDICCDLLNIATIGKRAQRGNSRRNYVDEFVRTKGIYNNLKKMLAQKDYEVAHVNTSCGTFGLIRDYLIVKGIRKKQPNCKRVVHFHCDVKCQTQCKYKMYFLKKMLVIADEVLVLNEYNKQFLSGFNFRHITVISNFIDEKVVRKQDKVISDNIEKAVFVGFVQPQKGIHEIYELALQFSQITFELVGEVRDDVKKWRKPNNVILYGSKRHEDIIKILDNADIFVFPTHSEGFSIALLESMSRGLPCVTTLVGANAEMIERKGGILVPVNDVAAMIEAIKYMQDPVKRKEMSKWNVHKVSSDYTVRKVMKKLLEIYVHEKGYMNYE